jgi:uncharacterized membrane protein
MQAATERPPPALAEALDRLEACEGLGRAVGPLAATGEAVVRPGAVRDLLTGTWLGHALHPLMTDIPIGFWTSTSFLDVVGGRSSRRAALALLAAGNLAALPTVATGLAEWLEAGPVARRVGVVHAGANAAGLALDTGSLVARLRGRHGWGALLALGGMGAATVGGYLGGHLAFGLGVGVRKPNGFDRA